MLCLVTYGGIYGISYEDVESKLELGPSSNQQSQSSLLSYSSDTSQIRKKSLISRFKEQKEVSMILPPFLDMKSDEMSETSDNNSSSVLGSTNDPNSIIYKSLESVHNDTHTDGLKKRSLLGNNSNPSMNASDSSAKAEKKSRTGISCGSMSISSVSVKRVSKVAGRLGFDFGAYLVKFVTRRITSVRDEEKIDVMSSTGFVTFLDLATVTCVTSAPLTHKPKVCI